MTHDPGNPFDAARISHEAGQRDMLAKCIALATEMILGMPFTEYQVGYCEGIQKVRDSLRALQEKP